MHPVGRHVRPILKVKQAPKRAYPLFRRFLFAIANHFLGDPIKTSKIPKIFVEVRQYLGYASSWPSRPIQLIFKVTRARNEHTPISTIFVSNSKPFLGDPDFDVKNAKFFRGRPSRP